MYRRLSPGLTIIELMLAIACIGVIAAVAFPLLRSYEYQEMLATSVPQPVLQSAFEKSGFKLAPGVVEVRCSNWVSRTSQGPMRCQTFTSESRFDAQRRTTETLGPALEGKARSLFTLWVVSKPTAPGYVVRAVVDMDSLSPSDAVDISLTLANRVNEREGARMAALMRAGQPKEVYAPTRPTGNSAMSASATAWLEAERQLSLSR